MRQGRPLLSILILGSVLATGLVGVASAASPQPSTEATTPTAEFPTPEDAIGHYLAGVANGDVGAILASSAIDEVARGFQFDLQVERLQAMMLLQSLAPADHPFYAEINQAIQSQRILSQVLMLSYSLLSSEQIDGRVIVPADLARAERFVADVDPSRLAGLAVQDVRPANAALQANERYLDIADTQAGIHGADELTERLALISLDGQLYDVGFTLLRYGETWKVLSQSSAMGETTALGTARPTTADEYERQTSGD